MRKLSLLFIAMLILVVMVFAMTQGSALGVGKAEAGCPLDDEGGITTKAAVPAVDIVECPQIIPPPPAP